VYTLGFVLPFLAVGLFTGAVLGFFKKHQNVVKYTVKVGAALLVLMGVMTLTGYMNSITSYLSSLGGDSAPTVQSTPAPTDSPAPTVPAENEEEEEERPLFPAPDFTLTDQYGVEHTLSDYQGKTVFLNFWATWCGPCKNEMPHIQELYEEYEENTGEELIVLGVANPRSDEYPRNQDVTQEEVEQFLTDNGYTFPSLMDPTGDVFAAYGVRAFPTTFMIDKDGNLFGYITGQLTREMMDSIIQQTITGERV